MHHRLADQETLLPEGEFIYSRTDLKGIIVEANEAFARISAYTRAEMIGQAHSLVRHPDMPASAFTDMWTDLRAGRPWRGLVKNRRKDGGFYWVVANASPVREGGRVVGYQSIRTRPNREEVDAATAAYQRIRDGDKSIRVEHGRVVRVRNKLLGSLLSINVQQRLLGLVAITSSALFLACNTIGGKTLHELTQGFSILVALYSLAFLVFIVPKTTRQLQQLASHMEYVLTTGDLTRRFTFTRQDVIGVLSRRFDVLISSFQATMQGIGDVALHVGEATTDVSRGVGQIHRSAAVQGDATASSAAAVEEVAVAITEIANHAASTQETVARSRETARLGAEQSSAASAMTQTLATTVQAAASQVKELGRRSQEISRITSVISEIADQTNLLALNAAIEAARAGETGRGFAVVADEVRKLAERTGGATKEIAQLVSAIATETEQAVQGMEAGAEQVETSVTLVASAKDALDEINTSMADTLSMVSEISHATAEQRNAISALSGNVQRVAEMTEQNVAIVTDTERLATLLDATVDRMVKAVGQYSI